MATETPDLSRAINWYALPAVKKYAKKTHNPNYESHKLSLPMRAAIIGPSGSGKSQTLLQLLHVMPETFNRIIYLIMSDTDEPLIKFLQEHMDGIEVYNSWRDFPDINDREEFPDDTQSLIILDDFVTDVKDQKRLEKAIISMRKRGISCVMLVQNFIQLNITVRKNLSHLFIKRLGTKREAKAILDAYSLGGIDADTLISIYKQCIETDSGDNTGFMTVDLTNPDLMFRKCLQPLELPSS